MINIKNFLCIFAIFFVSQLTIAQSVNDIAHLLNDLDCSRLQKTQRDALCSSPMLAIGASLVDKHLSIKDGDIIYQDDQFYKPQEISSDGACRTKEITGGYLTVSLASTSELKIFGNEKISDLSLDKPIFLGAHINADVETTAYFKERAGAWIFKCVNIATDNWSAVSKIRTGTELFIAISLQPQYMPLNSTEQLLVIQPAVFLIVDPERLTGSFNFDGKDNAFSLFSASLALAQQPLTLSNLGLRLGVNALTYEGLDDVWGASKPLVADLASQTINTTVDLTLPVLNSFPSRLAIDLTFKTLGVLKHGAAPGISMYLRDKIYDEINASIAGSLGQEPTGTYYVILPR